MTVRQLYERLDMYADLVPDCMDDEVVIRENKHGIGPLPSIRITNISQGFDWDKGKMFLQTEYKVIRNSDEKARSPYDESILLDTNT